MRLILDASGARSGDFVTIDWLRVDDPSSLAVEIAAPNSVCAGTPVTLSANTLCGLGPFTFGWDLDGDGTFEASGQSVNPSFQSLGDHTVRCRVADSQVCSSVASTVIFSTYPRIMLDHDQIPDFGYQPTVVNVASGS